MDLQMTSDLSRNHKAKAELESLPMARKTERAQRWNVLLRNGHTTQCSGAE